MTACPSNRGAEWEVLFPSSTLGLLDPGDVRSVLSLSNWYRFELSTIQGWIAVSARVAMRKFMVVIMVLSGLALIAGCGDDDNPTKTNSQAGDDLVGGTWQGHQRVCGGDIESIEDDTITFLADGTGTGTSGGLSFPITWSVNGDRLTVTVTTLVSTSTNRGDFTVEEDVFAYTVESEGPVCTNTIYRD